MVFFGFRGVLYSVLGMILWKDKYLIRLTVSRSSEYMSWHTVFKPEPRRLWWGGMHHRARLLMLIRKRKRDFSPSFLMFPLFLQWPHLHIHHFCPSTFTYCFCHYHRSSTSCVWAFGIKVFRGYLRPYPHQCLISIFLNLFSLDL